MDGSTNPGASKASTIPNTQVARIIFTHNQLHSIVNNIQLGEPFDYCGNCNPTSPCSDVLAHLNEWGTGSLTPDGMQKEVIITIQFKIDKSVNGYNISNPKDLTYIPPDTAQHSGELIRSVVLDDLEKFGRMFPNCVDYVQFYNEVYTGQELYISDPDMCDGFIGEIQGAPEECLGVICQELFFFIDECRNAVLRGSVSGPRPMRFISPAFTIDFMFNAGLGNPDGPKEGGQTNNRAAFLVEETIIAANDQGMLVDQHLHYEDPNDVGTTISTLLSDPDFDESPGEHTCLELGPKPNPTWWDANDDEMVEDYYSPLDPPTCIDRVITDSWKTFIENDWEADDTTGFDGDFELRGAFDSLGINGFHHGCYGPTNQRGSCGSLEKFEVAALRAGNILKIYIPATYELTPLHDRYQTAVTTAPSLINADMEPHNDDCPDTCSQ